MPRVFILTLGCPKNTVSSRRLGESLLRAGLDLTEVPEEADALVVNTCGFIEAASQESIDTLLELAQIKANGGQRLVAVGCLAERYGEELAAALPELDICIGLDHALELPQLLGAGKAVEQDRKVMASPSAYLEITFGCDHGCSFCTIPGIHGPFKSRALREIRDEAAVLVQSGARELVLVGQETGAYGSDLSPRTDLAELLRVLPNDSGLAWLRVLYLQWYHVDERLLETMAADSRICNYLDIPVQHASSKIVKAMNRRGDAVKYLERLDKVRAYLPEAALRTSLIVGFPGETDEDILELAEFLRAARFDYVGVFEFSAEAGTAAASFPGQVSSADKRERADQIRLLADDISHKLLARRLGRKVEVLVEEVDGDLGVGRAWFQAPEVDGLVQFTGADSCRAGDFVEVRVTGVDGYDVKGSVDA